METVWGTFNILPIAAVPVELLDAIGHVARALTKSEIALLAVIQTNWTYLEPVGMLVTRPSSGVRIEEKLLFVLLGDVVIQVLCDGKLPMELRVTTNVSELALLISRGGLAYLFEGDTIVL